MNKSALKKYAPQARLDFIAAVTRRAELLGLNPQSPAKIEKQGEALLINGRAFPAAYGQMRTTLEARIRDEGFAQVMEAIAYTWFNRLVAVRYMELRGFLDHGYRVLSHPANTETGHTQPEILDHIADLDLPGLDKSVALELKLAGNKDEELYREVLLAQCHSLHQAMPFLFESLDDATELLLPDGLLRTDSILGKLVTAIDEADWQDVEIIGWLYQFYISEKKDQVIGKVVKSEDIPAATQLFTPNWIVKYLVQNSLGRLWLMANPTSTLAAKWEYYIQPAEQTPEVNAQLDALIQARVAEDGATLNPESLTLLDPACGSGHILVEAYDLLRDIYLERGYRRQDIPRLILEKNLYGLDIDDRAAQLAGFALLMKARKDDRRLFGQPVELNVLALQEAKEGSAAELHSALNAPQIDYATVSQLVETFEQAKTFGSLIQIHDELANALPNLRRELETVRDGGDLLGRDAAETMLRLVAQAGFLASQYDAVAANPPYMGTRVMPRNIKVWTKKNYPKAKADLFSCFIERARCLTRMEGVLSLLTLQNWMFLASYTELRKELLQSSTITDLAHIGFNTFPELNSKVALGSAFSISPALISGYESTYIDCNSAPKSSDKNRVFLDKKRKGKLHRKKSSDFLRIPSISLAYWATPEIIAMFDEEESMSSVATAKQGMATTDNEYFLRRWAEIDCRDVVLDGKGDEKRYWFPYNKGGEFRRWYGPGNHVVRYTNNGEDLIALVKEKYPRISDPEFVIKNRSHYFRSGITWTDISLLVSARWVPSGFIFDTAGPMAFFKDEREMMSALAFMNTSVCAEFRQILNPSLHFTLGDFDNLPFPNSAQIDELVDIVRRCIEVAKKDWCSVESSFEFQVSPIISKSATSLAEGFSEYAKDCDEMTQKMVSLEEKNNRAFLSTYGLEGEISAEVSKEEVSLFANPRYRQSKSLSDEEAIRLLRENSIRGLVSYAVGCLMGRYSLDVPGLVYAHAGNENFDFNRYEVFPADDDGIVPITDEAWFDDDGANRIREFVRVVWAEDTEAENMAWLAESLGSKTNESADDTIRRYLSRDFYKDHLQTYKKRPIYWLFSSGKHKAFEALVYLHRYNARTLSRMRMEYVVPLQSRMQARIDNLDQDIQSSTSSAEQKRFQKQKDKLIKQLDELRRFDENLRHYADRRITLDLDDGVKVNYGKFGDLLAEVKAVTGKKAGD